MVKRSTIAMASSMGKKKVQQSDGQRSSSRGQLPISPRVGTSSKNKSRSSSDSPDNKTSKPVSSSTVPTEAPFNLNNSSSNTPKMSSKAKSPPSASMLRGVQKTQEKLKRNLTKQNSKAKRRKSTIENNSEEKQDKPTQRRRRRSKATEDSINNNKANEDNKRRRKESKQPFGELISLGKNIKTSSDRALRKDPTPQQLFERKYIYDQKPFRQGGFKFRMPPRFDLDTNNRKPRLDRIYGCEDEYEERQRELHEKYSPWTP